MRQAFGKSYGKACRVKIGDYLVSIRCRKEHLPIMLEALRRGSNKLPGRQKIAVSVKYGFTQYTHFEMEEAKQKNLVQGRGSHIKIQGERGSLKNTLLFQKLEKLVKKNEEEESEQEEEN